MLWLYLKTLFSIDWFMQINIVSFNVKYLSKIEKMTLLAFFYLSLKVDYWRILIILITYQNVLFYIAHFLYSFTFLYINIIMLLLFCSSCSFVALSSLILSLFSKNTSVKLFCNALSCLIICFLYKINVAHVIFTGSFYERLKVPT